MAWCPLLIMAAHDPDPNGVCRTPQYIILREDRRKIAEVEPIGAEISIRNANKGKSGE